MVTITSTINRRWGGKEKSSWGLYLLIFRSHKTGDRGTYKAPMKTAVHSCLCSVHSLCAAPWASLLVSIASNPESVRKGRRWCRRESSRGCPRAPYRMHLPPSSNSWKILLQRLARPWRGRSTVCCLLPFASGSHKGNAISGGWLCKLASYGINFT